MLQGSVELKAQVIPIEQEKPPNSNPPLNPPEGDLKSLTTREFVPFRLQNYHYMVL